MNTTRPILKTAAATMFAATLALGLAACGSAPADTVSTVSTKPAPALTKDAPPSSHDFSHEPRCFPALPCSR